MGNTDLTTRKIGGDSKLDNKELTNNTKDVDNIMVIGYERCGRDGGRHFC